MNDAGAVTDARIFEKIAPGESFRRFATPGRGRDWVKLAAHQQSRNIAVDGLVGAGGRLAGRPSLTYLEDERADQ